MKQDIIEFTEWKDVNFYLYKDGTYYAKPSSFYFDITKFIIGKEKPTKYYTLKELFDFYRNN